MMRDGTRPGGSACSEWSSERSERQAGAVNGTGNASRAAWANGAFPCTARRGLAEELAHLLAVAPAGTLYGVHSGVPPNAADRPTIHAIGSLSSRSIGTSGTIPAGRVPPSGSRSLPTIVGYPT